MGDCSVNEYAGSGGEPSADSPDKDSRQVIVDLLRVVASRRWFFFIPCCVGLTAAFLISHYVPRRYIARTILERRNDPLITSVVPSDLERSLDTVRRSMSLDLMGREAIRRAMMDLKWTADLPRDQNGALTLAGSRKVASLASDIDRNLQLKVLDRSNDLDLVELAYAGEDPVVAAEVVNRLRDNYVEQSRERLRTLMQESHALFDNRVKEEHAKLASVQNAMETLKENIPKGVDLRRPETIDTLIASLRTEQEQLRRTREELAAKITARENFLKDPKSVRPALSEGMDVEVAALSDQAVSRLRDELGSVETRIKQLRTGQRMKELHPAMQQYVRERQRLELALAEAKQKAIDQLRAGVPSDAARADAAPLSADVRRVMMELEPLRKLLKVNEEVTLQTAAKLASLEKTTMQVRKRHQQYLVLEKDLQKVQASLTIWDNNLASVNRWFEVDGSEKSSTFRVIEPARPTNKPHSPRASTVFIFCLFLGGLAGVAGVLLAELFDPTLRTAGQVSKVLGVPIIEGVSEIITPAANRQRFLRRVVYQPALAVAMLLIVSAAGTTVYLSIEKPTQFDKLKKLPGQAWSSLAGPPGQAG